MKITELLGHKIRLGIIVELYRHGEMSTFELVSKLESSYRVINEHLKMLEAAGFVKVRRVGRMKMIKLSGDPRIQTLAKTLVELDGKR